MAFFGFNASGHNPSAPGFSQAHDPFAGLSGRNDEDDALEFDDTYDGLGDQLEETGDAFNDDTFGGGGGGGTSTTAQSGVGKDFDFFGATAKVADAFEEEHLRYNRAQPTARAPPRAEQYPTQGTSAYHYGSTSVPRPARSGYEKYKEPEAELEVDAALWGVAPKKPTAPAQAAPAAGRKMMSLEEVEAAMRSQTQQTVSQPPQPQEQFAHSQAPPGNQHFAQALHGEHQLSHLEYAQMQAQMEHQRAMEQAQQHNHGHPITILQRPHSDHQPPAGAAAPSPGASSLQQQHEQHAGIPHGFPTAQPTQILQNPNRLSADASRMGLPQHPIHPTHRPQVSFSQAHGISHPSQVAQMSEEEKVAHLEQEAKRAKRNHKIFLLSKDNGVMTPQDKNFITRIQLQQLVAATGNPNEHGTDGALDEDFYYQVHHQIRGGQRSHPNQPLNNFAQTYLHQTGSRHQGMRRHNRGPENHMQRMEQQVQRAVEAAKNKPKNKQLVIEGSLGKISFSNAKTPKPLLNIKRADSDANNVHKAHQATVMDRKSVLRDIEKVYSTLMQMEDNDRKMPPPVTDEGDLDLIQSHVEWSETAQTLNNRLWGELKVHEPIGKTPIHPFIAFLSFPKGKKAIPRVFRHATHEQRTTILTMIIYNLDQLDVIRGAQVVSGETILNAALRESIELFSVAVMSSLFNFMNELDLDIVSGVLGLLCGKDLDLIARTRIGASMLTMILSRAEIIKESGQGDAQAWQRWDNMYTQLFNLLEGSLPHVFPGTVSSGEDVYVWQLLAALGIGANPDQQQRLVLAVKDRVMDTVTVAKTLPADLASARLQSVNLFMRSIGLDVELLQ